MAINRRYCVLYLELFKKPISFAGPKYQVMKNIAHKLTVLILLLIVASVAYSQDKIYKLNKEVILCKIVVLGEDEVSYTMKEMGDLVIIIDADRIEKIVFESGKEITFSNKLEDPELYLGQKKNAIKVGMFSPLTGALSLGYERSIKPGQSMEGTIGLIGIGRDIENVNPGGAYIKYGYKFISTPNFAVKGMRYSHLLKGGYLKPEISFATYQQTFTSYNWIPGTNANVATSSRENVVAGTIMLNIGKQWVLGDLILVDLYGGMGYGFDNVKNLTNAYEYGGPAYHYGFIVGSDMPLAFTAGFKVGMLIK
jgi:hypothetical protein